MFVILKKKEYERLRADLNIARFDAEYYRKEYDTIAPKLTEAKKKIQALQLLNAAKEASYKEDLRKHDMEWYAKWSDEVQKRAAISHLLQQELDKRLGLSEDDDEDEGEDFV